MRALAVAGLCLGLWSCGAVPAWVAVGAAGAGYVASVNNGITEWFRWHEPVKEASPKP